MWGMEGGGGVGGGGGGGWTQLRIKFKRIQSKMYLLLRIMRPKRYIN